MMITTYALAIVKPDNSILYPTPNPHNSDMPICFSFEYADFLFRFAETRVNCQSGDKIMLLMGEVDISSIINCSGFTEAFKQQLQNFSAIEDWTVIRKKNACCTKSPQYKARILDDLRETQQQIIMQRDLQLTA